MALSPTKQKQQQQTVTTSSTEVSPHSGQPTSQKATMPAIGWSAGVHRQARRRSATPPLPPPWTQGSRFESCDPNPSWPSDRPQGTRRSTRGSPGGLGGPAEAPTEDLREQKQRLPFQLVGSLTELLWFIPICRKKSQEGLPSEAWSDQSDRSGVRSKEIPSPGGTACHHCRTCGPEC